MDQNAKFDRKLLRKKMALHHVCPLIGNITMGSGIGPLSRQSNPIHAMKSLFADYLRINELFRNYSVFPATQNRNKN